MSARWRHTHSERPRGLVRLREWHDTPVALTNAIRTSGAACPVVLERLSNTPARLSTHIFTDARVEPREAVVSARWSHSHSDRPRGLVRLHVWHDTLLAHANAIRTCGAACPVVLERLSNTPARLSRHIFTDA